MIECSKCGVPVEWRVEGSAALGTAPRWCQTRESIDVTGVPGYCDGGHWVDLPDISTPEQLERWLAS